MARGTATVDADALLKQVEETGKKAAQAIKGLVEQKRDILRKAEKEMKVIDDQIFKLNFLYKSVAGKDHRAVAGASNGHERAERGAGKATTKGRGKRTRLKGIPEGWLESHLKGGSKTLQQLQHEAEKQGFSRLSIRPGLTKIKAKAQEGERKQGVKGKAPQLWTLR